MPMKPPKESQKKPLLTPKPYFKASIKDSGVLEMVIYEEIGQNWWDDSGVSAKTIKQQMDSGTYDRISVRINSPGGDAFEGTAIYNLLLSAGKPVDVFIDGIAASAASIIAMAGDTITMGKNAMMMIHNAWGFCMGNAVDMAKMSDTLQKVSDAIAVTYTDKTGMSADKIKSMMDAESWMGAEQCLKDGFATAISGDDKKAIAMAGHFKALGKMKNVPDVLKAATSDCECECQACLMGNCPECSNEDCVDANCEDCPMQTDGYGSAMTAKSTAAAKRTGKITLEIDTSAAIMQLEEVQAKAAQTKAAVDAALGRAETTPAIDPDLLTRELQLMRMRTI